MILETLLPVLSTLGSATVFKPSRPERKKKKKNKQTNGKRQKINNHKTYHAYLYPVLPVFVYLLFFLCLWSVGWGNWKRRHFRKEADSSGFKGPNRCHHQREVRFYTTNYFVLEENGCPSLCQKKDKPNETRVG